MITWVDQSGLAASDEVESRCSVNGWTYPHLNSGHARLDCAGSGRDFIIQHPGI